MFIVGRQRRTHSTGDAGVSILVFFAEHLQDLAILRPLLSIVAFVMSLQRSGQILLVRLAKRISFYIVCFDLRPSFLLAIWFGAVDGRIEQQHRERGEQAKAQHAHQQQRV